MERTMWNNCFKNIKFYFFFLIRITPCKTEQPLQGMELQEKKHKKDYRI